MVLVSVSVWLSLPLLLLGINSRVVAVLVSVPVWFRTLIIIIIIRF